MFGWLSDHIGREQVMFIAFSLEALGILALGWYGSNPWAFVVLSGIVFFAWGEVYSLFSATAGDTFGTKNIGTIYGLLYCAKGVAALLVPFGNLLMEATGHLDERALHDGGARPQRGVGGDFDPQAAAAPSRRRRREDGPRPVGVVRARVKADLLFLISYFVFRISSIQKLSGEIVPSAPGMRDRVLRIAPAACPPRSAI